MSMRPIRDAMKVARRFPGRPERRLGQALSLGGLIRAYPKRVLHLKRTERHKKFNRGLH